MSTLAIASNLCDIERVNKVFYDLVSFLSQFQDTHPSGQTQWGTTTISFFT
jgi:hypothetical protein